MNTKKNKILIKLTKNSINKIKELISQKNNPNLNLRIFLIGGGCSGFQYSFSLEEKINEEDCIIKKDGIKLIVDPLSFQYLIGSTIDYVKEFQESCFKVINPNAKSTCSCGTSFGI